MGLTSKEQKGGPNIDFEPTFPLLKSGSCSRNGSPLLVAAASSNTTDSDQEADGLDYTSFVLDPDLLYPKAMASLRKILSSTSHVSCRVSPLASDRIKLRKSATEIVESTLR